MNIQVNTKTYRLENIIAGIFALKETKKRVFAPLVQIYQYAELMYERCMKVDVGHFAQ